MTSGSEQTELLTEEEVALDKVWLVYVFNDPVNLMSYVTHVFRRVFGYSREKARKHMLEVHEQGRSLLWRGGREEAEHYVYQLQSWQLDARLLPEADSGGEA